MCFLSPHYKTSAESVPRMMLLKCNSDHMLLEATNLITDLKALDLGSGCFSSLTLNPSPLFQVHPGPCSCCQTCSCLQNTLLPFALRLLSRWSNVWVFLFIQVPGHVAAPWREKLTRPLSEMVPSQPSRLTPHFTPFIVHLAVRNDYFIGCLCAHLVR